MKEAGQTIAPIISSNFSHSWKPANLWKASVVVDNVNLLLDTFYENRGRKVICFDNDDDIWGNNNQRNDFNQMMSHWRTYTASSNRDEINLTFDHFDPLGTSLTAIPDLVSGAVASILHGLRNPEWVEGDAHAAILSDKARVIGDWIWWKGARQLQSIVICVNRSEKGIHTFKLGNPFVAPPSTGVVLE